MYMTMYRDAKRLTVGAVHKQFFEDGFRFVWRNGDANIPNKADAAAGTYGQKCLVPNRTAAQAAKGNTSNVTAYVWLYVFKSDDENPAKHDHDRKRKVPESPPSKPDGATFRWGTHRLTMSSTGPTNVLPAFRFQGVGGEGSGGIFKPTQGYAGGLGQPAPFAPHDGCADELFADTMDLSSMPLLPWANQDDWGCERNRSVEVPAIIAETSLLRAVIMPQFGGRVWSLWHKKEKRELVFANPAHQPASIGYRNAWTAGGIEFNWSPGYVGHSAFTESPVYAGVVTTPTAGEDVLRLWEYDRINGTVWQVDLLMRGEDFFAHVTITNPNAFPVKGYWCVHA
jgi:hypothetical protein